MATPPDFTAGQVLTAAQMNAVGMWRITTCTIDASAGGTAPTATDGVITVGSANTSITVANAFNADFDNYRIIISGIDFSSGGSLHGFRIGTTATGYFGTAYAHLYTGSPSQFFNGNNATSANIFIGGTESDTFVSIDVAAPFLARRKSFTGMFSATGYSGWFSMTNTSLATATDKFMIVALAGSMTGGEIRVYGYNS